MRKVAVVLKHKENRGVISVGSADTVFDAITAMAGGHVGALPVIDDGRLVGIVSERDYARKVILKDRSSKTTTVADIMTRDVITVTQDDPVSKCVDLMREHHIRHLVVTDEAGGVAAMISLRDLHNEIIVEQAETIDHLEHYIRGENE